MVISVKKNLEKIIELCKIHHVKSIALFGSAANNSMNTSSDIDLLVEFADNLDVLNYADNYFSLLEELEKVTGRKIDLVSAKSLRNPVLKEEINKTKVDLYAA